MSDDPLVGQLWDSVVGLARRYFESEYSTPFREENFERQEIGAMAVCELGAICARCKRDASTIGLWKPDDPTLLDGPTSFVIFLTCGQCTDEQIADFLAAAEASTS